MLNFTYYNPTRIVFGKGTIAELKTLVPGNAKILMTYGGGSIKSNGVYAQVHEALEGRPLVEFGGIEANPQYETCLKAVAIARSENVDFLLAVGGGSVIDATKFVAAALKYSGGEPWALLSNWPLIRSAVPLGVVLTLPGTGSEMNGGAVISRHATQEKLFFSTEHTFPQFSIIDPEATYSLPKRQFANGTIDAFVQVLEQYLTYPVDSPLQDRFSEGILKTILEEAPKVVADPKNYTARANLMWCATNGLNGLIGCGVPQDWASHMIGHELTVLYGVDHGQSLALVMPLLMRHQRQRKRAKLLQYARRVWGLGAADEDACIDRAIANTEAFFRSLGASVRLAELDIPPTAASLIAERLAKRRMLVGEHHDLGRKEVEEILSMNAGSVA
jgi:NADP-dependent alcohol dehydrogenase